MLGIHSGIRKSLGVFFYLCLGYVTFWKVTSTLLLTYTSQMTVSVSGYCFNFYEEMIIIHIKYNLVRYIESTERTIKHCRSVLTPAPFILWLSLGGCLQGWQLQVSTYSLYYSYLHVIVVFNWPAKHSTWRGPYDFVFSFLEPLLASVCPSVLAHSLLRDWHRKLKWGCGTLALWKTVVIASCSPESRQELWQLLRFNVLTCIWICPF